MSNTSSPSMKTWFSLLAGFQAVTLLALWGAGPAATPAHAAGIPDEGAQREQLIDQLKTANAKLDRLITLLADGKLEVTLRKTEDANRNR